MAAVFNSPSKYIQGPDELAKLGSYVEPLGAKALVIVTPSGKKRVGAKIEGGFAEAKAELLFEDFNGECSKGEVDRLVALARDNGCDIIVGVGGGKILDTAKAVAYYLESPVIICPTIASTDAPCRHFRCSTPMTASSTSTSSLRQTPILSLWIRRLSRRARCA
ncbi:MAG: iron-containing alcohol dehydrogenase [Collinsella sp.]